MAAKKILMLVGDFVEDYEAMMPFQMLLMVGHEVHTVCPAVKPDVERAGAHWCEANDNYSNAYVDGNLVTAPAWPAHPEWIRKFLHVLGTRIEP
jgi:putative intracellular protease/amidase